MDFNGHALTDNSFSPQTNVGTKLLGSYAFKGSEGWLAPGHNSILQDGKQTFIVHHARGEKDKNWPYLHIRQLLWSHDGWPLASPERYAGETVQAISAKQLPGNWERLPLPMAWTGTERSEPIVLEKGGRLTSAHGTGTWEFHEPNELNLKWASIDTKGGASSEEKLIVMPAWDWENNRATLVFTGMNEQGINIWGKYADVIKGE